MVSRVEKLVQRSQMSHLVKLSQPNISYVTYTLIQAINNLVEFSLNVFSEFPE